MGRRQIDLHPAAQDAALIMGQQIRLARQDRNWTASELAARAGVTVNTVLAVEAGQPTPSIGNVLNLAVLAGVPLFGAHNEADLAQMRGASQEILAHLPKRVRHPKVNDADYDF